MYCDSCWQMDGMSQPNVVVIVSCDTLSKVAR